MVRGLPLFRARPLAWRFHARAVCAHGVGRHDRRLPLGNGRRVHPDLGEIECFGAPVAPGDLQRFRATTGDPSRNTCALGSPGG
eukprot:2727083-Alexandrium_andersonii.AAC.1